MEICPGITASDILRALQPSKDEELHAQMIEVQKVDESRQVFCRFSEIVEKTVSSRMMTSLLENRSCFDTKATFEKDGTSVSVTTAGGQRFEIPISQTDKVLSHHNPVGLKITKLLPLSDGILIQAQERRTVQRASGFIFGPELRAPLVHFIVAGHPMNEPTILQGTAEKEVLAVASQGLPIVVTQDAD